MRMALGFLAVLGIVLSLYFGRAFFLPVVISLLLAAVIWPPVNYLHHHWRMPRALAGLVVIAGCVALTVLGLLWGIFAIQRLVHEMPQSEEGQREAYERVRGRLSDFEFTDYLLPPEPTESVFYKNFERFRKEQVDNLPNLLRSSVESTLLILFMVLFLVIEGEFLIRKTGEIFGPSTGDNARAATKALREMAHQVRAYIVWRAVINVGMALFLGVYFQWLGLKQAWTWAVLAGVLTFIPYIGPVLAGVPPILEAFVVVGPGAAFSIIIVYTVILVVEGYIVFPILIGRNMEMNATTVMLACLFWWFVWGEVGLFLAMPLAAGLKAICQNVPGWQPWANLMGMEDHGPGRMRRFFSRLLGLSVLDTTEGTQLIPGVPESSVDGNSNGSPHGSPARDKATEKGGA
jgi:predicted PurR-regulated permease PerM